MMPFSDGKLACKKPAKTPDARQPNVGAEEYAQETGERCESGLEGGYFERRRLMENAEYWE